MDRGGNEQGGDASALSAAQLVDAMADPFALFDASWRVVHANAAAGEIAGRAPHEMVGRAAGEFFAELGEGEQREKLEVALREGRAPRFEHFLAHRGAWLELVASACGPFTALVARDITQRKQTEAALLRSRHELADFFENATVGLHWLGADGRILWVNDAELAILGYARDEVVGRPMADFHVERAAVEEILARLFAGETLRDVEVALRRKDGTVRDALLDVSARWEGGRFVHGRCFTRDVTDAKLGREHLLEANRALRRSNEDLEQFAYAASHDLREPLRMITIYTQLLHRRYVGKLGNDADDYIKFIVDGALRMEQLLRDLLAYSHAGSEASPEGPRCASNVALDDALQNLAASLETSGARVEAAVLPEVRAEHVHLVSIFQNLVGNSLKYRSHEPPRVRVEAERDGAAWTFSVADNGIGIEPRYHEQVFRIFKRLHGAKYSGTGVGLAICAKLVERYGGRIWVESELGRGSTFRFTLPG